MPLTASRRILRTSAAARPYLLKHGDERGGIVPTFFLMKPNVLLMGQTPPPWHGQAVATQILFEHGWPDFEVHRLRMEYSEEMVEVGRFQWKKIRHLFGLIRTARKVLKEHPGCVLFYPPASAKWVPFLRDVVFLASVRHLAGGTVFIYHASGLPVFAKGGLLRSRLARIAYHGAEMSLEVAREALPPHEVFAAGDSEWCPCGIEVPQLARGGRQDGGPLVALFVGSLQEGKGVLEVLKTAAVLKDRGRGGDFVFRLVGKWFSTEFEKEVRETRKRLGLEEMVELTGQLTGDDKWAAYRDADVFFFPTHYESEATPIVIMEALGAGLPVVTTRWAGIPAMLEGCGSARLLEIRSPERYAEELAALEADPGFLRECAEVSKAYYRARYLPERFIERVADALRAVTTDDGGRAGTAAPPAKGRDGRSTEAPKHRNTEEPVLPSPAARHVGESASEDRKTGCEVTAPSVLTETPEHRNTESPPFQVSVYLADQNPGYDRSFGISRMSQVVLGALMDRLDIDAIVSRTSQRPPAGVGPVRVLPWGTRRKWVRLLTDHFHPLFHNTGSPPDLHYFPKGYLPLLHALCSPSVVTIHDTIIQYDADHYPDWRKRWEYSYWARMLAHTLRHADRILTVSHTSKTQIEEHMDRLGIPRKPVTVTYEPCAYEELEQPADPEKDTYVIHLASVEPHKRTAHLIRWWHEAEHEGRNLPSLHLVGSVPKEVAPLLKSSRSIVRRPFLEDAALQDAYRRARALVLPSEIEGFGLPALEAYYLGTPVCFVRGTSVEEVLGAATPKGGFTLDDADSLFTALDEVMAMPADEVRACGLKLRETYAASRVAERMMEAFRGVAAGC